MTSRQFCIPDSLFQIHPWCRSTQSMEILHHLYLSERTDANQSYQ
uniref:Uncharacterized protein n=1 Tax=Arundo donax TaxID=35708 RepID=A0A0A9B627_ARUDO